MSKELKPCPFCGGDNLHIGEFDGPLDNGITVYVRCTNCGGQIEGEAVHPEPKIRRQWALEDALTLWGRRYGNA